MRGFVLILIVLVVGVIGFGFYRNWFNVTVTEDKFEADTHRLQEKFAGKPKDASGTVRTVEAAAHRFTLATASDPGMTVVCTDASKVWRKDREAGTLSDLRTGDEVSVQFRERGGKYEAMSVTIGRK
jgi:Cu/Ag efflux protein CusF